MTDSTPRIALVTGANKGIGKEIVGQLAARGMTVWLGARDEGRGRAAVAELSSGGDRPDGVDIRWLGLDVTDMASIAAAAKALDAEHGRLDVLVNNAGVLGPTPDVVPSAVPVDALRAVYETNVFGPVALTNALLPLLRRSQAGRVVNLSSELGSLALTDDPPSDDPPKHLLGYNSSKTALNMITLLWARELSASGIKVNVVSPGFCATDMNGHTGTLNPADGAAVAVHAATIPDDGPTGTFLNATGVIPW